MPELPEVEVMTEKLKCWAEGRTIQNACVLRGKYFFSGLHVISIFGQKINSISRAGKQIIFELDKGTIVCHNSMSGFWDTDKEPWTFDYVEGKRKSAKSDIRVMIPLDDGTNLFFHDARLFGRLEYYQGRPHEINSIMNLGPEAVETKNMLVGRPVFDDLDFVLRLLTSKSIKESLMQQDLIAGIGNIYASEALWRAQISPVRLGKDLNPNECVALLRAIQSVLGDALDRHLAYEGHLNVYRQKTCKRCLVGISRVKIANRSTYFCEGCQK